VARRLEPRRPRSVTVRKLAAALNADYFAIRVRLLSTAVRSVWIVLHRRSAGCPGLMEHFQDDGSS